MRLTRAFIDRVYEESITYRLAVEEDPGAAEGQSAASSRNAEAEMVRGSNTVADACSTDGPSPVGAGHSFAHQTS